MNYEFRENTNTSQWYNHPVVLPFQPCSMSFNFHNHHGSKQWVQFGTPNARSQFLVFWVKVNREWSWGLQMIPNNPCASKSFIVPPCRRKLDNVLDHEWSRNVSQEYKAVGLVLLTRGVWQAEVMNTSFEDCSQRNFVIRLGTLECQTISFGKRGWFPFRRTVIIIVYLGRVERDEVESVVLFSRQDSTSLWSNEGLQHRLTFFDDVGAGLLKKEPSYIRCLMPSTRNGLFIFT